MRALVIGVLAALLWVSPLQAQDGAPPEFGDAYLQKHGGIPAGRSDALYGTYGSNMRPESRGMQSMLDGLEDAVYGLSAAGGDLVSQAERTFLLEKQLLSAHQIVANADAKKLGADKQKLVYRTVRLLKDVQYHSGRLFEAMVRTVDVALPGPNGRQLPRMTRNGEVYDPNYRSDERLTKAQQTKKYAEKMASFKAEGGKLTELKTLSAKTLKDIPSGTMVEYIEWPDGTVRFTAGDAGHILLAEGKPVRSAGQFLVMKDKKGAVTAMYVTNGSGSYKPDILAAQRLADGLARKYRIPGEHMIVSKGMPANEQTVKILLKAKGVPKPQIKARIAKLKATAVALTKPARMKAWTKRAEQKHKTVQTRATAKATKKRPSAKKKPMEKRAPKRSTAQRAKAPVRGAGSR